MGNSVLQRNLGWDDEQYYRVRDRLIAEGVLARGRGRGGSVTRAEPKTKEDSATTSRPATDRERSFYGAIERVLKDAWTKDQAFTWSRVETTAQQGRRKTGGRWTRPDLAVISLRDFLYLPVRHLDVWTFEVKMMDGLDVTAVYEALAHARSATRAYVMCKIPEKLSSEQTERLDVVRDEAARHGVGVITMIDPGDFNTWEETVEGSHLESDPERLNDFISKQFSPDTHSDLLAAYKSR